MPPSSVSALLLRTAIAPVAVQADAREPCPSFGEYDADRNGHLSMEEFKARGKDDLSFRAADIDGDGRVDPGEFDGYVRRAKASESGAGDAVPPQPGLSPGGY